MPRSKKKSSRSQNHENLTRVRSKFHSTTPVSTATLVSNIGALTTSASGILSNDANLAALSDMFRLFKINSIEFHFSPQSGASTAGVEVPSGFLAVTTYGNTTAPTSMADFETPLCSMPTMPFGTASTTAPLTRECGTLLKLKHKDLPVLQGSPDGFLATQDDGSQTSYGSLFWTIAAATAANTINYLLTSKFDISFKDLLDPGLISSRLLSRHPNGIPDGWIPAEAADGHCLAPYTHSAVLQRRLSKTLSAPPLGLLGLPPSTNCDKNTTAPGTGNVGPSMRTLVDPSSGDVVVIPAAFLQLGTPQ